MPPTKVKTSNPEVYFNEWDSYASNWIKNLYPSATVDKRSINDIKPQELRNYRRCHFFAGIAGWEHALELAGWPRELPVWSGSCPCQPFSTAGRQPGTADPRHLWPVFGALIRELRPPIVFGEQVAGNMGFEWLDGVRDELENADYSFGAACLPAGAVGAPQRRYRLFWVANSSSIRRQISLVEKLVCHDEESFVSSTERLLCNDGKLRRTKSGVLPLADGFPGALEQLRAYGNAIVPKVAATFVKAFMKTQGF